jgi:hypothetical protein
MKIKRFLLVTTLLAATAICGAWGVLVHETDHQIAVYELPVDMQHFFFKNMQYLTDSSVRPDLRRSRDTTEATKHFIDIEMYGDSAAWKMPLTWNAAVAKYTKDTLLKYGYVPYYIVTELNRLTNAFALRNADSILFYAADMGHYIEDAHVPLHTSKNYDGQLTNQRGIHALWESVTPGVEIGSYNLYTGHTATYIKEPEKAVWQAIRKSYSLVPGVFATEKKLSASFPDTVKYRTVQKYNKTFKYYTETFAKAYGQALKPIINQQAVESANMVADFWYTAWVNAGKPNLEGLLKHGFSSEDAAGLTKQLNAYKHNTLVKDSLLNALKVPNFKD